MQSQVTHGPARWLTAFVLCLSTHIAMAQTLPGQLPATLLNPDHYRAVPVDEYASLDPDIFALPRELLDEIDSKIAPIRSKSERALALHKLLFGENGYGILYDGRQTFTAAQTFHFRRGNCLSLALLFTSAARHVGLPAKIQTVEIPTSWERGKGFYIVPGHVNALIPMVGHRKMVVEFLQTYYQSAGVKAKTQVISDRRVLAEYHNNIAMEYMNSNNFALARSHYEKSIATFPKLDFVKSNLGVLSKREGRLQEAEQMYLEALKINRRNLSALTNLYILLSETGRIEAADAIAKRVERYTNRNPYHLAKLADTDIEMGNYSAALRKIKRAIHINPDDADLYRVLAQANYFSGDIDGAINAFTKARDLAANLDDRNLYQKKLQYLTRNHM